MITIFSIFGLLISLINSHLLNIFGIDFGFYVNGNYEFTKSIFFSFITSFIFIYFIIKNFKNKINIPKKVIIIYIIFFISIISSDFFITNIFGSNEKGHGILLYTNLSFLYLILLNIKKENLRKIINYSIILSIIPVLIAIKEYFIPTFDYGNLSNRAFGTFGHPNYLALYIITIIPFLLFNIKNKVNIILLLILSFTLFLTKSLFGITIFIFYIIYFLFTKYRLQKKYLFLILVGLIGIATIIIFKFGFITKLNSFVSRFYIWETTIYIIFSNFKYIIFGVGNDSLVYLFDSFKSPFLYIYENIGFSADRPHNLFLQIFYNFGLIGLAGFTFFTKKIFKNIKNTPEYHSIIIFFIFTFFNFPSIVNYVFLIFLLSYIYKPYIKKQKSYIFKAFIIIAIFSIFSSFFYYKEEYKIHKNKNYVSNNIFYNKLVNENPEKKIFNENKNPIPLCEQLTNKIKSVENYFYCGNILWNIDKNLSKKYYKKGLEKIPNMWDKTSKYYDNKIVKLLYSENRFFSKKFSNIKTILKRY